MFPNAIIKTYSPGMTGNLIVRMNGKVFFEKKVQGDMNDQNAQGMVRKIEAATSWAL